MTVLVAYASKHGATQEIAEHVAAKLKAAGIDVDVRAVSDSHDLTGYSGFVVGGAAYIGSWLKDATEFVRANREVLSNHPTWLFSSGPLGFEKQDAEGKDLLEAAEPKEFSEFRETIRPRGLHVFFGVLDPGRLALVERLIRVLPAGRELLPEGDFREWEAIDAWAEGIALELSAAQENAA